MRLLTLALFLCAGSAAFCQSTTPAPAKPHSSNPDKLWQLPPEFAQPQMEFGKLPHNWDSFTVMPRTEIVISNPARVLPDARIDRNIIVHPPQASIGVQPPGKLVAQNLYPNLRLLPIDWPKAKVEQIPTDWPRYKLESIPTEFGGAEMLPVHKGKPVRVRTTAP